MWMPLLAVVLLGATAPTQPSPEAPDRALLEFLAEFDEAGPESAEAEIDPLWLASADASAELDRTEPATEKERRPDAETEDDRPR